MPAHLVPYGSIIESMKTWNVGTIETVADLSVLARLWMKYLRAEAGSVEEVAVFNEWARNAERVSVRCLPALQQLEAAGLLRMNDLRTGKNYPLTVVAVESGIIELSIETEAEPSLVRKRSSRKR